ncbi:hypothetical protein C5167_050268 [Papaver somniferum]|uniref:BED-type domain-containing protein n=1 Tax=Papaver somniferum TaxID=3469 RepID=A0A4Y7KPK1_PAPSO|nr:hypothetical protein C5167_050268 [Papaver somniferum]
MTSETGTFGSKNWAANGVEYMEPKSMMEIVAVIDPVDGGLGSSEKGNVTPAAKPRKKSMTSLYLKFFETAPDGKSRSCKFCKQSYSIATATGNLGRHLNHRHPGYDTVSSSSPQPITTVSKAAPSQVKNSSTVDFDHVNWLLLRWLICNSIPPSIFEDTWLSNSFKFANSVQLWSVERFQTVIVEIFRSMRDDMYSIENRILSCTHDNSSNAIHACHTLQEDLDAQKSVAFCFIPCAARTLNLIIEDGLQTAKPVISKIREFVLEMNTSVEISSDFNHTTSAYQEGSWKFPIDASTRWSGNYTMLDIVRRASKSMDAVIRKRKESLGSRNMLLSTKEIVAINNLHQYLEPFHKTTNNMCTSKVPTVGLVLFFMDHIVETIASCRDSRHSPDWLKNAAEDMAKKARSYNSQVHNVYTYMAAILDPRIKGELIPDNLNLESYLEEARNHFLRSYSTIHFPTLANGYNPQDNEDGGSVSFAEEIARKRRRINMIATQPVLSIRAWIENGFKLRYRTTEVEFEKLMVSGTSMATTSAFDSGATVSDSKAKQG